MSDGLLHWRAILDAAFTVTEFVWAEAWDGPFGFAVHCDACVRPHAVGFTPQFIPFRANYVYVDGMRLGGPLNDDQIIGWLRYAVGSGAHPCLARRLTEAWHVYGW